jgi:hypothetical protein
MELLAQSAAPGVGAYHHLDKVPDLVKVSSSGCQLFQGDRKPLSG